MRTYTIFLAFFLMAFAFSACESGEKEPTVEEILIGSWKLRKFDMKGQPTPIQVMATASFNFSRDMTYEIVLGNLERGTWSIGKNQKVLITVKEGSVQEQHIDLEKVTKEEVILVNNTGPNPVRMTLAPDL